MWFILFINLNILHIYYYVDQTNADHVSNFTTMYKIYGITSLNIALDSVVDKLCKLKE